MGKVKYRMWGRNMKFAELRVERKLTRRQLTEMGRAWRANEIEIEVGDALYLVVWRAKDNKGA
jgi:hypothetical protein